MISRFIAKRIFQGIVVIFSLSILSFAIINAAPGDPATALYGPLADRLTTEERARINRNYGVDRPVTERYIKWTNNMIKGDLEVSYLEGRKITDILKERIPNTLMLFLNSITLILIFSLILGLKAGFNEGSLWDKFISGISVIFYSIPSFWLALLFIIIFSVQFGFLPSSGNKSISGEGGIVDTARHLIMPVSVMVIAHVGAYARFIQEKVKEESNSHYVTAARSNGMEEKKLMKGIIKNALVPFINYLGITIPGFFGGSVMIETVFSWPGLGMISVKAANSKDYPLLMGTIFITGVMVVLSIIITDILELSINPSLRKQVT
ncbi:ABC transporter permease [Clostridium magnum]|uniref:Glutathione transport system permease protein GsiC n=1 Tax=Clostridium magnum DSM 2767 TaxID=1121326 RepID=A0A162SYW8_9CLOT|nr:ABC transporter permease [Clostridium magnum]KZL92043.1 glutathione transport system permease protein GsiC [Clostridium magnum DSM 2767]SHH24767.1 peptide/nickel transport system permease protein [Clostridium magnum DSM 2767]